MTWSPQQDAALKAVEAWFKDENGSQVFRLFGFAGTGKTTLAKELANIVKAANDDDDASVCYAAFTGKAALVMRQRGCRGASTIHSLIYTVDEDSGPVPRFVLNEASDLANAKLCIIDECSMVGAELAADLLSFGTKVLVLGDPAQLPPVQDAGYFTNAEPDIMLTEVHRQARDNPIIRMSMQVREGGYLDYGDYGACKVIRRGELDPQTVLAADQLLVGTNKTRVAYNSRYRHLKNYKGEYPKAGEKLVCLKNDRARHLFNGGLWTVEKVRKANGAAVRLVVSPEDAGDAKRSVEVKVHPFFFDGREGALTWEQLKDVQQFTYGYALTVHKAQGSQWKNVVLFDESGAFRENARWHLYTGITRAVEQLVIVK